MSLLKSLGQAWKSMRGVLPRLVGLLCAILALGSVLIEGYLTNRPGERSSAYEKQIEVLDQVHRSIDNLKDFVTVQRKQLQEQQGVLEGLKDEREKLLPVVEADRQVVESLFRIQAERNLANVWKDYLIGFLLGILSSLIASLLWTLIRLRWPKKSLRPADPASAGPGD